MHSPTLPPLDAAWSQGLVTAHVRVPRQRSKPSRKASLGLRLPSARPGSRAVGFPVARPLVWGRGCRARSRRIWRFTGTASAADPLGRPGPPASMLGHRGCAAGVTLRAPAGCTTTSRAQGGGPIQPLDIAPQWSHNFHSVYAMMDTRKDKALRNIDHPSLHLWAFI